MENSIDNWSDISSDIQSFYTEVINKILPHARSAGNLVVGSPDHAPTTFRGKISTNNLLKESPYEFSGENDFLHFTSLQSLIQILDTGHIRMSEFGNLIDKQELSYAASIFENEPLFSYKEHELDLFKQSLFCLSLLEYSADTVINPFMWEAYGKKGRGTCLRIKLTKPNPYSFVIGKVLYGYENLYSLHKLKELALSFKPKAKIFPSNFFSLILELQSFHKSKKFSVENEIRLLFREDKDPYKNHDHLTIYKSVNPNDEVKYFNKLFIKNRHELLERNKVNTIGMEADKILDISPQIEIQEIIIGNSLKVEEKIALLDLLTEIKTKHKYDFQIKHLTPEQEILNFR
jgi:hypothetical protein